jgi:tetratricopeptide (TPR) repeat protein
MNTAANPLESRCTRLQNALAASQALGAASPAHAPSALIAEALEFARAARGQGRADLAVPVLERLVALAPHEAGGWQQLGFARAEEQRMPEAAQAFERAARLDPKDPVSARSLAQSNLDAGYPAAHLFDHALRIAPGDLGAVRGRAAALAAEGRADAAMALLDETLARFPDWLDGHKSLAALRFTSGDARGFAASYAAACDAAPRNLALRMAWFGALMQRQDWQGALEIVAAGEHLIGPCSAFAVARTLVASESDDRPRAAALFAEHAGIRDDALQIAHLRHCLRTAQLEKAEQLALELLERPVAPTIWPYLSLIWRLRGDARAQWLDGAPPPIRVIDLDCSAAELEQLAVVLRRLHTARAPHVEQSVRGGTQTDTDRQLFHRAEPEIQSLRSKVCAAVRAYVAALPPHVPGHPLLGTPRGGVLFSGSWSVRLRGGGFHVSHTHPMGWISSALYVSLPEPKQRGAAPAGWIAFGRPPQGLGVALPEYGRVEPKPGRLVLFPSTLWHQTLPFDEGERLVIAFDVMRPRH